MQIQPKIDYSQLLSHFVMFKTTVNRQLSKIERLFDFEDINPKEEIQEATDKFEQLDFELLNGPYETLQDHYEQLEYHDSKSFQMVQTIYAESIVIEKNEAKQYYLMYFEPQIEQVQMQYLYMEIQILDAPDLFGLSFGIGDPVTNKGLNITSSQLCEENEDCQVYEFKSGGRYGLFVDKCQMQVRFTEFGSYDSQIVQVFYRLHYEWKHFFVQHHLCKLNISFRTD